VEWIDQMTQASERTAAPAAFSFSGVAAMLYGAACYLFFFVTFLYIIGFMADAPFLPKTVDHGQSTPPLMAALINFALLGVFALQHSVMARPAFKRAWTQIVPKVAERSTYVLAATLCVALLIWQWRPMDQTVWHVTNQSAAYALWALQGIGGGTVLLSTYLINHFELFGLRQTFSFMIGHTPSETAFRTPLLYKHVRHPLYLGFVIAFWSAPHMSIGHLLFAIGGTGYILVGIFFEERDLVAHFGQRYREYQKRVPMLLPFGKRG
jgi:protein-S-isoprenylcysteine O-methyltransferase Ste14